MLNEITKANKYCLLELNVTGCSVTPPMTFLELNQFIKKKYAEQPLEYFNDKKLLWIINLNERTIKILSLKIEL